MYIKHTDCKEPKNKNIKIWRYLDITKFLYILEKRALFFHNLTNLSEVDPLEGILSEKTVKDFKDSIVRASADQKKHVKEVVEHNFQFFKNNRNIICVNSWHMNNYESTAMWSMYLKSNEGIAIQSTYKRLRESFNNTKKDIFIGIIKYIDGRRVKIPLHDPVNLALYKRKSYEYEKELRVIAMPDNYCQRGIYIPVDVDTLIAKIYLAPNSPKWFLDLVENVMKRYNINKKVIQSSISKEPLY